jgi:hypothetical protein
VNANQLADELETGAKRCEDHGTIAIRVEKAAAMLRAQQAEIEALKAKLKSEFDYVEKLLKAQDK